MRLEWHNQLREANVVPASRVVIYDKFNNPILVAMELTDGTTLASTLGCPDFHMLLAKLGVNKTVVIHDFVPLNPAFL